MKRRKLIDHPFQGFQQLLCYSWSTFVSVFTIKRPKDAASAVRACGILLVKILNKCILSILIHSLFLDRQRNVHTLQYFHTLLAWLSSRIEIQTFKNYSYLIGQKDNCSAYCICPAK